MNKRFIDLFAGCGGLSLGLIKAGWQGIFAIERSHDAFKTLKHNLIEGDEVKPFRWPRNIPCEAMTTSQLINGHEKYLRRLRGKIDLIAGGPPCQGFSFAGRRNPNDPRNKLTGEYIQIVEWVQPKFLLLENVKGFTAAFKRPIDEDNDSKPYSEIVKERLESLGYVVFRQMLNASLFGVPQPRPRFIMIAVREDLLVDQEPFGLLEKFIGDFRVENGLPASGHISVKDAISDLETFEAELIPSPDTAGFKQIKYTVKPLSRYQQLMRRSLPEDFSPNSLRLPNHKAKTSERFQTVLDTYPKGKSVKKADLEALGTNKHAFTPLHPSQLSKTITTLPDDLLHYSEARILTVRESARIQSFPDWFEFLGKYTTGGARRKEECPRYSQVGNAVPPLMAEAIGLVIQKLEAANG